MQTARASHALVCRRLRDIITGVVRQVALFTECIEQYQLSRRHVQGQSQALKRRGMVAGLTGQWSISMGVKRRERKLHYCLVRQIESILRTQTGQLRIGEVARGGSE